MWINDQPPLINSAKASCNNYVPPPKHRGNILKKNTNSLRCNQIPKRTDIFFCFHFHSSICFARSQNNHRHMANLSEIRRIPTETFLLKPEIASNFILLFFFSFSFRALHFFCSAYPNVLSMV